MPRIEQRDIDAIQFAEVNPKLHDQGALASSEQRYGFVEIPVEREETGRLVAGQGRIEALRAIKKEGLPAPIGVTVRDGKWFVDVRVFPFKSDAEAQSYLADSNNLGLLGGDFNAFDIARLWDSDQYTAMLKELAEQASLPVSVSGDDLDSLLNPPPLESDEPDTNYSRKVEAPIYTPKREKPNIGQLFDDSKTKQLIADIDTSNLPDSEKQFLRIAAQRHTVLNFKLIADYYAHSDKPTQKLMEDSALVIIDFNRAIELGYVKLSEEIARQYAVDYPDA